MAAGDLVVYNYQYEFRELLFGHGTSIIVERSQGIMDLPGIKDMNVDLDDQEGEFLGPAYPQHRFITFDLIGQGYSRESTEKLLHKIQHAFVTGVEEEDWLVFKRPGRDKLMVPCRAWRRSFDLNYQVAHGLAEGSVALRASCPQIYSYSEKKEQIVVADASVSDSGEFANNGNYRTLPTITLEGEWDNPVISNADDNNRQVRLNLASAPGDTIVINFEKRTVVRNGVDVTETVQRPDTQWWYLQPGINEITFTRDNAGAQATAEVAYRDAWV